MVNNGTARSALSALREVRCAEFRTAWFGSAGEDAAGYVHV